MHDQLSIRSYQRQQQSHAHDYYQLVLPLSGVIEIAFNRFDGRVGPGEGVLIGLGQEHRFRAAVEARFVVADLQTLPANLQTTRVQAFAISPPLVDYLQFVETQLEHRVDAALEASMLTTFKLLLAEQRLLPRVDQRIQPVLQMIEAHLAEPLQLKDLAQRACLGETQFKKLFREQVGQSVMNYVTQMRMDKARALLRHTDYPIQRVAEQVGYTDLSAFSRRFSASFGLSPSKFKR